MRQYLFDGIDIDWHYPVSGGMMAWQVSSDDADNTLLNAVYAALIQ